MRRFKVFLLIVFLLFNNSCIYGGVLFKVAKKVATTSLLYGLPAIPPLAYLCVREAMYRMNMLNHVSKAVDELQEDISSFRDETSSNFHKTSGHIEKAKRELVVKNEATKKVLKKKIQQTDDHLGDVEKNIRKDVRVVRQEFKKGIGELKQELKQCAKKGDIEGVQRKLAEILEKIEEAKKTLGLKIDQAKEEQMKHLQQRLAQMESRQKEKFKHLSKQNESIKGMIEQNEESRKADRDEDRETNRKQREEDKAEREEDRQDMRGLIKEMGKMSTALAKQQESMSKQQKNMELILRVILGARSRKKK